MTWPLRLLSILRTWKLRILGHAQVEDIPTEAFKAVLKEHVEGGWAVVSKYDGFDAWIDYGRVDLRRGGEVLIFEWDWVSSGKVVGPRAHVRELAERLGLPVARVASVPWRW